MREPDDGRAATPSPSCSTRATWPRRTRSATCRPCSSSTQQGKLVRAVVGGSRLRQAQPARGRPRRWMTLPAELGLTAFLVALARRRRQLLEPLHPAAAARLPLVRVGRERRGGGEGRPAGPLQHARVRARLLHRVHGCWAPVSRCIGDLMPSQRILEIVAGALARGPRRW